MSSPSIEPPDKAVAKATILDFAAARGFVRARILAPFSTAPSSSLGSSNYGEGAPSALVAALAYGNGAPEPPPGGGGPWVRLDKFSQRNYYAEAVARLKRIAVDIRDSLGGGRSDFRILCNSPVPEKPMAVACGLGVPGRNSLIMTPEAGSSAVIAVLALPFALPGDPPLTAAGAEGSTADSSAADRSFPFCGSCRLCVEACPTAALPGDGSIDRTRCIQWFASRPGEIPDFVAAAWGDRLYGCSVCRDVCPANRKPLRGIDTDRGALPELLPADELIESSDAELSARFKGTALGMGWFGPAAIRRNARIASRKPSAPPIP